LVDVRYCRKRKADTGRAGPRLISSQTRHPLDARTCTLAAAVDEILTSYGVSECSHLHSGCEDASG